MEWINEICDRLSSAMQGYVDYNEGMGMQGDGRRQDRIDWVKDVLTACITDTSPDEKRTVFQPLSDRYYNFSQEDRKAIFHMLWEQFEPNELLCILSEIVFFIPEEIVQKTVLYAMMAGKYSELEGIMLEYQTVQYANCYSERRRFHRQNVERLGRWIGSRYSYIPATCRKRKRVAIVTEQIMSPKHSPTLFVLNFAYVLQKFLGFDVTLFSCPSNGWLSEELWGYTWQYCDTLEYDKPEAKWKDAIFPCYQYDMNENARESYVAMLSAIYEYNPLFVLQLGVINPVADLIGQFTTTASKAMSSACPVTEADILLRTGRKSAEEERGYNECLGTHQKQLFLEDTFPLSFEESENKPSRSNLKLPGDMFLIAIVGNRLDQELDKEFAQMAAELLQKNQKIAFVFIGVVDAARGYFAGDEFQNHIYYLGYCPDLIGVYGTLNLYLNPKRHGGGVSAVMAMFADLPVVTLPDCDVAFNVGSDFIVSDYEQMVQEVLRYVEDSSYYKKQKQCARERALHHTESAQIQYVSGIVDRITQIIDET